MGDVKVDGDTLGFLARLATMRALATDRTTWPGFEAALRSIWPSIDDYDRTKVVTEVEIALACNRVAEDEVEKWQRFVKEMRPPKSPFTVDYRCCRCKRDGMKLWRGIHGAENERGENLLCAACLAPGVEVDELGKYKGTHGRSDQVGGWLPAIPTEDTYWGYTSVPSADIDWWRALPTYRDAHNRNTPTMP